MTQTNNSLRSKIRTLYETNLLAKIAEIVLAFIAAFIIIKLLQPLAGWNLVMKQTVIWCANIVMLLLIYLGMRIRGEYCSALGLTLRRLN